MAGASRTWTSRAPRWLLAVALLLVSSPALADRIDALAQALRTDPSWRVKVQAAISLGKLKTRDPRAVGALIEALRNDNEGVRAVAAETLAHLGDRSALEPMRGLAEDESPEVRIAAKKAIATLEKVDPNQAPGQMAATAPPPPPPARYYVQLSDVVMGKGDAAAATKIKEVASRELTKMVGVTLDPAATTPKERFAVDANITTLKADKPDSTGRVQTHCGVRFVVATLPEHSIKLMATLESAVEGTNEPGDLASARLDCLVDVARQVAEKVGAFLETHK